MIGTLLLFALSGRSIQKPSEPADQEYVCAIAMGDNGDREERCYNDLVKALDKADISNGVSFGGFGATFIVTSRAQAPRAIQIAKTLSKEKHFEFFDLTDPVVAESLEPRARHDDPVEFRRRVADFLKLGTDAPLPVLIATSSFKGLDLPVLGDGVYVPFHTMDKAIGKKLHLSIQTDIEDFPPAGRPPLKHYHSSIYAAAEDAYAELQSILQSCQGLPNTVELADLQATKRASQDAVIHDANLDFDRRGLSTPVLIATVESGHESMVAEITSALGSSPFYWYNNDTTGDTPLGWPELDVVHSSLFVPVGDFIADLNKIKARLGPNAKGVKLFQASNKPDL